MGMKLLQVVKLASSIVVLVGMWCSPVNSAVPGYGSVVTWGPASAGGNSTEVASWLAEGVVHIVSTISAFAVLKTDGRVITWGDPIRGGDSSPVDDSLESDVVNVYATDQAFAALKANGSVVAWGEPYSGGSTEPLLINSNMFPPGSTFGGVTSQLWSGVVSIASTRGTSSARGGAFAALKDTGEVVTWGGRKFLGAVWQDNGGQGTAEAPIARIVSACCSFSALKPEGKVVVWGTLLGSYTTYSRAVSGLPLTVKEMIASSGYFAYLMEDGSSYVYHSSGLTVFAFNVVSIVPSEGAFAALSHNGQVITWGDSAYGGDASAVASELNEGVVSVYATNRAFAALKRDQHLVTWGHKSYGGNLSPQSHFQGRTIHVFSNAYAFVALTDSWSLGVWGDARYGGENPLGFPSTANFLHVFSLAKAFAAINGRGGLVVWGHQPQADVSSVEEQVKEGVIAVIGTELGAGAALKYPHIRIVQEATDVVCETMFECETPQQAQLLHPLVPRMIIEENITIFDPWRFTGDKVYIAGGKAHIQLECLVSNGPCMTTNASVFLMENVNFIEGYAPYVLSTGAARLRLSSISMVGSKGEETSSLLTLYGGEQPGSSVSLHQVIAIGGHRNASAVSIQNVTFLRIDACIFHGSTNRQSHGGCVSVEHVSRTAITACSFQQCAASGSGGGVYAASGEEVIVRDSNFQSCNSEDNGGAISIFKTTNLRLESSILTASLAGYSGGAVMATNVRQVAITGTQFENGRAMHGGCVLANSMVSLDVQNSSFHECLADLNGGALLANAVLQIRFMTSTLEMCHSTQANGGGLAVLKPREVSIADTALHGCTAAEAGGGLYALLAETPSFALLVNGTDWYSNEATTGGALYVNDQTITLSQDVAILDSIFTQNSAAKSGGAIFWSADRKYITAKGTDVVVPANLPIILFREIEFLSNKAEKGGGAYCSGVDIGASDSTLSNNNATQAGGGLFLDGSVLTGSSISFRGNSIVGTASQTGTGGAISATSCLQGGIVLQKSTLSGNRVLQGSGGAVYAANCRVSTNEVTWVSNEAVSGNGGAVCLVQYSTLSEKDGILSQNRASQLGGAVYCSGCQAVILNRVAFTNSSASYGGAVYMRSAGDLLLATAITMTDNSATGGGAMFLLDTAATVSSLKCQTNQAMGPSSQHQIGGGGCFYFGEGSAVTVQNSVFIGNNASHGGDIYLGCFADFLLSTSSSIDANADLGELLFFECTPSGGSHLLDLNANATNGLRAAGGTVNGTIEQKAIEVIETVLYPEPVLTLALIAADGRHCLEDYETTCTASASANGKPVALLQNTAFQAVAGMIHVLPFSFQGISTGALTLTLSCSGFRAFKISSIIPVAPPMVRWATESCTGIPSDTLDLIPVEPVPALTILTGNSAVVDLPGAMCHMKITAEDGLVTLLGQTAATPVNGTARFEGLGVDGSFGRVSNVTGYCRLASGAFIIAEENLLLQLSDVDLHWITTPNLRFLPSQPLAPFLLDGFAIQFSTSIPGPSVHKNISCGVELRQVTESIKFQLSKPVYLIPRLMAASNSFRL